MWGFPNQATIIALNITGLVKVTKQRAYKVVNTIHPQVLPSLKRVSDSFGDSISMHRLAANTIAVLDSATQKTELE